MANKPSADFKVRLSRTSSAQAVLKKERKKSNFKLDEILDEDKSMDTVTGKLPTEAAYVIMKRVTLEAGQPLNPAGISTFNKLQSLKTTPAVDLLMHQTWRNFFSKKTATHTSMAMAKPSHPSEELPHGLGNATLSSTEDLLKRQKEIKSHLTEVFDRLVQRVEQQWVTMKIPSADRIFYRKSLCKGPPQSVEQCREIAQYIATLKAHQAATIAVIQVIQIREMAIAKCFDVLAALQRKFSRLTHREHSLGASAATPLGGSFHNTFPSSSPQPSPSLNHHQHPQHPHQFTFHSQQQHQQADGGSGGGGMSFWKEELIGVLDEVRAATMEVVRRVQLWRRNLWRPHPFVYMGVNYVAKMKDDLGILESDMYGKLLALVPLKYTDLQCIVFFSNAGKIFVDTNGAAANGSSGNLKDMAGNGHSSGGPGPASAFPVRTPSRLPPAYPNQDWGASNHNGFTKQIQNEAYIQQMLQEFLHKVNPRELKLAATIVLEEEMLQNALAIEHASLLAKGVFIPTLHTRDAKLGEQVVSRNASSQQFSGLQSGAHLDAESAERPSQQHHQGHLEDSQQEYSMFEEAAPTAEGSLQQDPHFQNHIPNLGQQQGPGAQNNSQQHGPGNNKRTQDEEELDWAPDFAS